MLFLRIWIVVLLSLLGGGGLVTTFYSWDALDEDAIVGRCFISVVLLIIAVILSVPPTK